MTTTAKTKTITKNKEIKTTTTTTMMTLIELSRLKFSHKLETMKRPLLAALANLHALFLTCERSVFG